MLRRIILLGGLLVLLLSTTQALAGGWVVVTVDALQEEISAGDPLEISFMVRQHGQTPTHDLTPFLTAVNKETGESIRVDARKAQEIGRFTVSVNFPSPGVWEGSISAKPFPQTTTLAPFTVLEPKAVEAASLPQSAPPQAGISSNTILVATSLALLVVAAVMVIVDRRRSHKVTVPVSGSGD